MTVIGVMMMNVHIVAIMSVTWVRIVQSILTTEMMMIPMTLIGTKRGGLGMTPSYRRERLVVNRKTPKTATIPDTTVVVVKEQR